MNRRILTCMVVVAAALAFVVGSVAADSGIPARGARATGWQAGPPAAKPGGKLSWRLDALAHSTSLSTASVEAQAAALSLAASGPGSLLRDDHGRVLVDIRVAGATSTSLEALRTLGATVVDVSEQYQNVTAYVNTTDLDSLAELQSVRSIEEELAPQVGDRAVGPLTTAATAPSASCPQGINVSEGDTQLNAATARSTLHLGGAGVKVGVLSDSYDQDASAPTHAANDVASGDLPGAANPCGLLTAVNVISNALNTSNVGDEGRAMLQIVHDLAPTATLAFASAFNGDFAFASSIRNLRTAGSDIIVDDVTYFREPMFQDGPIAVAIRDVKNLGASYFTSAANSNQIIGGKDVASYEAPAYRATPCPPAVVATGFELNCHDFNPTLAGVDNGDSVTLANGGVIAVIFQWNEPWFGVSDDLDIFLVNSLGTTILAQSINDNLVSKTPFEFLQFQNTSGSTQTYRIVIARFTGTGNPRLKFVMSQSTRNLTAVQYNTSSSGDIVGPTIFGHSASLFSLSVAAAPYFSLTTPETFSSRGPASHYFGPVINSIPAPAIPTEFIQQPDFTATDGGCTTFFAQFSGGCWRFFGTSAAAPHAAAVGALIKEMANRQGKPLNQGLMRFILQTKARAMSGGNINSVGAGLIDALGSANLAAALKNVFIPLIRR